MKKYLFLTDYQTGLIKNNGNQLTKVDDTVSGPYYAGAFHFVDGTKEATEYSYDANGNMVMDKNKGISSISYDINNLPQKILYNDGRKASYVYDAEGNKHSVLYTLTAMTNALPQMPVMQSADAVKTGREIKSLTYGTYDYPGSIYPRIKFNLIKELSNNINVWKK